MLAYQWLEANEKMTENEYQSQMLELVQLFEQYKPDQVLVDARRSRFVIRPELQQWVNENVIAVTVAKGLKRIFVILSQEFIAQLSMEQMFDDALTDRFRTLYFATVEEAQAWLKTKNLL
jgi:predicted nucleotide-binding protein